MYLSNQETNEEKHKYLITMMKCVFSFTFHGYRSYFIVNYNNLNQVNPQYLNDKHFRWLYNI